MGVGGRSTYTAQNDTVKSLQVDRVESLGLFRPHRPHRSRSLLSGSFRRQLHGHRGILRGGFLQRRSRWREFRDCDGATDKIDGLLPRIRPVPSPALNGLQFFGRFPRRVTVYSRTHQDLLYYRWVMTRKASRSRCAHANLCRREPRIIAHNWSRETMVLKPG